MLFKQNKKGKTRKAKSQSQLRHHHERMAKRFIKTCHACFLRQC